MTPEPIKIIAFDAFGTVFSLAGVERAEIRAYLSQCTAPEWMPLVLPESWNSLPAYPDSAEGIRRLRTKYKVVTLSNGPYKTIKAASDNAGIEWDSIIDFAPEKRVYKPDPRAYLTVCERTGYEPADVLMVTANPTFAHYDYGDCDMARKLGMQAQLIRREGEPQTIVELAERLGC